LKRAFRKHLAFRDPSRLAGDNFFACVGRVYPLAKARFEKLILWRTIDFSSLAINSAKCAQLHKSVMRFSASFYALLKRFQTCVNSDHPVIQDKDPRLIMFWVLNFTSLPSMSSKF